LGQFYQKISYIKLPVYKNGILSGIRIYTNLARSERRNHSFLARDYNINRTSKTMAKNAYGVWPWAIS
jgi:hypothetical protein